METVVHPKALLWRRIVEVKIRMLNDGCWAWKLCFPWTVWSSVDLPSCLPAVDRLGEPDARVFLVVLVDICRFRIPGLRKWDGCETSSITLTEVQVEGVTVSPRSAGSCLCVCVPQVGQRTMSGPELLLDSSIRLWVVLPIVFITFLVGIIRHYVTQLLHSDKKVDLEQVSDRWAPLTFAGLLFWFRCCDVAHATLPSVLSQVLMRSRILRENGKYIPRQVSGAPWSHARGSVTAHRHNVCVCVCSRSPWGNTTSTTQKRASSRRSSGRSSPRTPWQVGVAHQQDLVGTKTCSGLLWNSLGSPVLAGRFWS